MKSAWLGICTQEVKDEVGSSGRAVEVGEIQERELEVGLRKRQVQTRMWTCLHNWEGDHFLERCQLIEEGPWEMLMKSLEHMLVLLWVWRIQLQR